MPLIYSLKKASKFFVFLLLTFLQVFLAIGYSQNDTPNINKKYSLLDLINKFEKEDGILFSYSDTIINSMELPFFNYNISLNSFLAILKKETNLEIRSLADNNFILYQKETPKQICGKVMDFYTNQPIESVLISNGDNYTYTGANGNFELTLTDKKNILIIRFGYVDKIIATSKFTTNCKDLFLIKNSENLKEVVLISNYLTNGVSKNTDGSISIKPNRLRLIPGLIETDVLQSMQLIPGISSPTNSATDINIRGGTDDQNLILWDGIKIYQSGHFFNQISALNPFITEDTKIFRSGASSKYEDRISGIIDITSTSKIPKRITSNIATNLVNLSADIKIPVKNKLGFTLAARKSHDFLSDIRNENLKEKVFQNTNLDPKSATNGSITSFSNTLRFFDTNFKINWAPNTNNKVLVSSLLTENHLEASTTSLFFDNAIERNQNDQLHFRNLGVSVEWKKKYTNKLTHNFTFYNSQYTYDFKSNDITEETNINFEDNVNQNNEFSKTVNLISTNNYINDIGASLRFSYQLHKKHSLLAGYQFTHNELNYTETNSDVNDILGFKNLSITGTLDTHNLFFEHTFTSKSIKFQAGLRASYFNQLDELVYKPRIFSSIKLIKNLNLNLSAEIKSQVIRKTFQTSDNRFSAFKDAWVIANDNDQLTSIPIIMGKQATIGFTYNKKKFLFDADFYIRETDGQVYRNNNSTDVNITEDSFINGTGISKGVDLLIKKRIRNYQTWVGYSFAENKLQFPRTQINEFAANNDITHLFNWSQTYNFKKFEIGLSWIYRSGLPYTEPTAALSESFEPILLYENINSLRLPDFKSLNASLFYIFKSKWLKTIKIKTGVALKNILFNKNIIRRNYSLQPFFDNQKEYRVTNDIAFYKNDNFSQKFTPDFLLQVSF